MKIFAHTPVGEFEYETRIKGSIDKDSQNLIKMAAEGDLTHLILGADTDFPIILGKNVLVNSVFRITK